MDLRTYFTVGPKEARAWTIPDGATAPQSAGVIHTDFEKGFIRAETIAYDDYVRLNGEGGAREAGRMRLEGKDYVVQDGDVMHLCLGATNPRLRRPGRGRCDEIKLTSAAQDGFGVRRLLWPRCKAAAAAG